MKPYFLAIAMIGYSTAAFADSESVSAIRAGGLKRPGGVTLTGAGVEIGQVDVGRTGLRPSDTDAVTNGFVVPAESRINAGQTPDQDQFADDHALQGAGIIIGKPGAPTSVAQNASLYSTSFGGTVNNELRAVQYIAKRFPFSDPNHIRAINHSWGGLPSDGPFAGNSQLTLGMDWMASKFDVLHVIAGAESGKGKEPSDNYNGITVAFLAEEAGGGYLRVATDNDNEEQDDAAGDRVSVDLLAPGEGLTLATIGVGNPVITGISGTSFAAPHVTGTVALLNEYGDYQVANSGSPRWDSDTSRKHEVMKAVLLNSADKKAGVHGSSRTILNENGVNWENSTAFFDDEVSLDRQMGAGALNAARALRQFRTGEYIGGGLSRIGWDYGETGGSGTTFRYPFSTTLGGYVAVTLAWDRKIDKNGGPDETYTGSDIFTGNPVDDLNLYLVPVGWEDLEAEAVARSKATDDSVEHIFKNVPMDEYEIVVTQISGGDLDFGLAWWAGESIPGDFNDDGNVDGGDLSDWRMNFGSGPLADGDADGDSDGADFLIWQQNVGSGGPVVPASVPEPSAWMLCALGLPLLFRRRATGLRAE